MDAYLVGLLFASAAVIILAPYVAVYRRWLIDDRHGFRYPLVDHNNDQIAKLHLLRNLRWVKEDLFVISGALHVSVWDGEVKEAIERALARHEELSILMLVGPEIIAYTDGSHPVYDYYQKRPNSLGNRWEIRVLKQYPTNGQGRYADGDLYLELKDGPADKRAPVLVEFSYQDYNGRSGEKATDFLTDFNRMWKDRASQKTEPSIKKAVKRDENSDNVVTDIEGRGLLVTSPAFVRKCGKVIRTILP